MPREAERRTSTSEPSRPVAFLSAERSGWLSLKQALLVALAVSTLAGCAQAPSQPDEILPWPGIRTESARQNYWWQVCARMPFDQEGQPRWSMDLVLADQIIGPALLRHQSRIALWRFHRRAAHDATGHQFSLLFYADPLTAEQLIADVKGSALLPELLEAGFVTQLEAPCHTSGTRAEVEGASDPNWAPPLQRTWPYFAMGFSAHWLTLIRDLTRDHRLDSSEPAEVLAYYADIDVQVSRLWREQGGHAYLHHLNAMFAYEPILIRGL